nr:reverse transcriptase domain-containing protein [Tanacetum cinerariifolium]
MFVVPAVGARMRLFNKIPIYYDKDDDEESSTPLRDVIISELPPCIVITPVLSIEDPKDSLIIGDEHLDIIPEKESDEFIKSSVKNLVPIPIESEDLSNIGSKCDVPVCDDFTTFSNLLFDAYDNFSSSDDESFFDEDVSKEIYSNPLFDEEIISTKIDLHHFNEFSGELAHIDLISPEINETDFDPEEEIRLVERLLYDNSSSRPAKEFNSKNSDAIIESLSPSLCIGTRSSARNLFPPLDNPELTIRRRSRVDPTLLNDFEMATNGNGDPPVPDLQTMEELYQPTLNGRGGPIAPIAIQATNFELKNDMIQQVQNSCQFHRLLGDNANKHLDKFLHVTQSIKVTGVTDDALRLCLFPHSMTHHSTAWFDRLPRNSINTFKQMAKMFLRKYFPPSMVMKLRNEITNFRQQIIALKAEMAEINKNLIKVLQINQQVKEVSHNYETYGGPYSYNDCPATVSQTQNVYVAVAYNQGGNSYQPQGNRNLLSYRSDNYLGPPGFNQNQNGNNSNQNYQNQNKNQGNNHGIPQGNNQGRNQFFQGASHGTLPSNTITKSEEDLKGITTRSGNAYKGPTIPTTFSLPKVVECETEVTKDTVPPTNNESTKDVQPPIVQIENPIPNSKPVVAPFGPTIKSLLTNKGKLFELARTPLNEHCSAVLLKTLPKKLGDPSKFLIPCDFSRMDECLALADLGASINLMPLSEWNKLSLPELSPMYMTLKLADRLISSLADLGASINLMPLSEWNKLSLPELSHMYMTLKLADRLISCPVGVTEDVFVKVGTFHFSADFVVVDFDADPRVPLILERSFLKTRRALIDVY